MKNKLGLGLCNCGHKEVMSDVKMLDINLDARNQSSMEVINQRRVEGKTRR